MSDHAHLTRPLLDVLLQGARLAGGLHQRPDGPELYVRIPTPLSRAGVGAHLRHCLDFVRALVQGLPEGRVDYDARERDVTIENDPGVALAEIEELEQKIRALAGSESGLSPDRALLVRMDASPDAPESLGWVSSTVGREFNIVMSHTIHHYALIAMTLRHFGEDPGPEFGVAPATLSYWREEGRCVPRVG